MDLVTFFIGFLLAAFLSTVLFYFIYERQFNLYQSKLEYLLSKGRADEQKVYENKIQIQMLELELTKQNERLKFAKEQIVFLENAQDRMKSDFEKIAFEVMDKNSKNAMQNQHESLRHMLTPFSQNLKSFQEKVEQLYINENKERFSLVKEISQLRNLNEKISQDAINLTNALKGDNKLQGNWGEFILEKVLESSGLKKDREYEIQKEYINERGQKVRPDVIVHLPDEKDVVIDSKVSLVAYEKYHSSSQNEKDIYIKQHLDSIYMHIKTLSEKRYESIKGIKTLDFVLLFIPIESAFMLAVEYDKNLYEKAYQKNIILVSPSTLLAVLRTIQHSWRYEYQNKNAIIIAKKAGDLYDKFAGFVSNMQLIDTSLKRAQDAYDDAFNKLSSGKGNLIGRAEELKALEGIQSKKVLKNLQKDRLTE